MESLREKKVVVLEELRKFETKDERLKYLIKRGRNMPPMDPQLKIDQFLIRGCISKAWLAPEFSDGRISFHADSEAMIVKGIMSILLYVFNNSSREEILEDDGSFLREVGITEHLSMNRRNSSANIIKLIHAYAHSL